MTKRKDFLFSINNFGCSILKLILIFTDLRLQINYFWEHLFNNFLFLSHFFG